MKSKKSKEHKEKKDGSHAENESNVEQMSKCKFVVEVATWSGHVAT